MRVKVELILVNEPVVHMYIRTLDNGAYARQGQLACVLSKLVATYSILLKIVNILPVQFTFGSPTVCLRYARSLLLVCSRLAPGSLEVSSCFFPDMLEVHSWHT